jgi:hypothetical protein
MLMYSGAKGNLVDGTRAVSHTYYLDSAGIVGYAAHTKMHAPVR